MTPVGSGTPGGVTGPGSGVGAFGSPARVVDVPHPARANRTSAAAMCFTVCPRLLESSDFGFLCDRDRQWLWRKRARDRERGVMLPGAAEVFPVRAEIVGPLAPSRPLDFSRSTGGRLSACDRCAEIFHDHYGVAGLPVLRGGGLVGAYPANRNTVSSHSVHLGCGITPALPHLNSGFAPGIEVAEQA